MGCPSHVPAVLIGLLGLLELGQHPVMVIEIVAARILAPYIGVSLYTWTSIIGIILAGIALGNYIGGKIADRYASPRVLMLIFFAGGVMTFEYCRLPLSSLPQSGLTACL